VAIVIAVGLAIGGLLIAVGIVVSQRMRRRA